MRKLTFLLLLFLCSILFSVQTSASSDYLSFESLDVPKGKLLSEFTESEYKEYYKKVDGRKFMGWQTHKVHNAIKATYVTETLFSYYNDGFTAIDYKYKLDRKVASKLSLSASGSIGIKSAKDGKGFKNNLDGSLKLSADYTVNKEDKETFDVSLKVDPGTQVDLYIYGEGKITNGVAARYVFWVRAERGGFEVFVVTTQYQRLEKKRI